MFLPHFLNDSCFIQLRRFLRLCFIQLRLIFFLHIRTIYDGRNAQNDQKHGHDRPLRHNL